MIETKLKALDLNDDESAIYLMLLKFGSSNVASIARITKIPRINCYHHLEKLTKKGLVSVSERQKVKHFTAENPKVFINREMERLNFARAVVPELLALSTDNSRKPRIQFFDGKDGVKNVFDQMTEIRDSEIVSFSNFERLGNFLPDFLPSHFETRLERKIKTRFISPRSVKAETFCDKFFPKEYNEALLEVFLISPDEFNFDSEITIFAGSIAILNLNEENPIGILIENPELFHTQKAIFDLAWLGATSFITQ